MHRVLLSRFAGLAGRLLASVVAVAGSPNTADYPLRVHLYQVSQHSHYVRGMLDFVDGEGRANLFENSEAHAFDYRFRCGERLMTSPGYETYLARWRKPGRELDILLPVMGKPNAAGSCVLKVEMKNSAYVRHNGALEEQPVAAFKEWMEKHQYDPEHGRNESVNQASSAANTGTAANPPQ